MSTFPGQAARIRRRASASDDSLRRMIGFTGMRNLTRNDVEWFAHHLADAL